MSDQTAAGLSTSKSHPSDLSIGKKDRDILKKLAVRVAEIAAFPVEEEKKNLWRKHNDLEPTRPVIFCDPENGWNEIITQNQIQCENLLARSWEMSLRKEIFWGEKMGDDRVVEAVFNIPYTYEETDWGMHDTKIGGGNGGSYIWDAPLKNYSGDFKQLRFPKIKVDYETTERTRNVAAEIMEDYLEVRIKNSWWWTLGLTWTCIELRGLEQFMLDMYDRPEGLHRLMAFLRDGHMAKLDFLEKNGLLSLNTGGTYVGSGGFGWTSELPGKDFNGGIVRTKDIWGFCESQETVSVSPEMFGEFVFAYQLPILERFGLNCYGCCEPIDSRWHFVKKIPRLRRVSVSAWAKLDVMAEYLGDNYIFSMKPSPTPISVPQIDEDRIRKSLKDAIHIARRCRMEIIMKDNHTIGGNPNNVVRWCRIAKEEAENI